MESTGLVISTMGVKRCCLKQTEQEINITKVIKGAKRAENIKWGKEMEWAKLLVIHNGQSTDTA